MVKITLGGNEIASGIIIEGRTYARVADILDGLGHAYQWDERGPEITVTGGMALGEDINDIQLTANFNLREFACRHCGAVKLDPILVQKLQALRDRIGRAITITSGYRCAGHNQVVGGAPNSRHVQGKAADIVVDGMEPGTVASQAEAVGFNGIGIYNNFTHVDVRASKARWRGEGA
jgi:hypothetical protein